VAAGTNRSSIAGPAPAAAAALSPTAAASQKLAAATTLPAILQAASEHLKAAKREFAGDDQGILNVEMIATVKHLGQVWHQIASHSIRTNQGNSAAAAAAAGGTGQQHHTSNGDGSGSSSSSRTACIAAKGEGARRATGRVEHVAAAAGAAAAAAARLNASDGAAGAAAAVHQRTAVPGAAAGGGLAAGVIPQMRLAAPQLADPSGAEVATIPLPCLPPLLDLSCSEPAKVLQRRLERVWGVLRVPAEQQMGLVLRWVLHLSACDVNDVFG